MFTTIEAITLVTPITRNRIPNLYSRRINTKPLLVYNKGDEYNIKYILEKYIL